LVLGVHTTTGSAVIKVIHSFRRNNLIHFV
jgi:hypothetical protein